MHRIKNIRNQLGLTQWELAGYLGIGRTVVNMVEKGRRHLNTAALLKLARLEVILYRLELGDNKAQWELPVKLPVGLAPKAENGFHWNTLVLNRKINKIDMGYQQAQNLENVLKLLADEEADKNLLNYLRLKVTRQLNRCSKAANKVISSKFLSFSNQCQAVRIHLQSTNCSVVL